MAEGVGRMREFACWSERKGLEGVRFDKAT